MKKTKMKKTVMILALACLAANAAPQPLFDPVASSDGRFWRASDVSGWRLKGTGRGNVKGRFEAAGGIVTCTISESETGFIFICY